MLCGTYPQKPIRGKFRVCAYAQNTQRAPQHHALRVYSSRNVEVLDSVVFGRTSESDASAEYVVLEALVYVTCRNAVKYYVPEF